MQAIGGYIKKLYIFKCLLIYSFREQRYLREKTQVTVCYTLAEKMITETL